MSHLNSGAQTRTAAKTDSTPAASATTQTASTDSGSSFWDDLLDVVNPLQHLPGVGTVYRAVTGDKIGDVEKIAGDTLYGGPVGLVSSLADLAFEKVTGKNFGDTVMGFVGLDHSDDSTTMLASNTPKTDTAKPAPATPTAAASKEATAAPTQLASIKPRIVPAASPTVVSKTSNTAPTGTSSPLDISTNTDALLQALARNGVTGDMQTQALDAYKRTMNLNTAPIVPAAN
jgi:hypothetical protein